MFIKKYNSTGSKNKGFTLLEAIISIAIIGLMVSVVGLFTRDVFFYKGVFSSGLTAYDDARKLLNPITSEIRGASPSSLGSYPIERAEDNAFTFFTDKDADGVKERIRYFLEDNILKKGVIVPTGNPMDYDENNEVITDIVPNLQNGGTPIFAYYDTNYEGTSDPLAQPVTLSDIRLVKITLMLNVDVNKTPTPVTVTTQVSIRNLKDNL